MNTGARTATSASMNEQRKEGADVAVRAPDAPNAPKGWHTRGYLPHCDMNHLHQMVTYRLADSLPIEVAIRLTNEQAALPDGDTNYRRRIEMYLDAGHGDCPLRRPEVAAVVLESWMQFDAVRYDLMAWAIMPNHVHVLLRMRDFSLSQIVKTWKGFTARRINQMTGRTGRLWQADYWDRYIRNEEHYAVAMTYILENPAKAGLTDWQWVGVGARTATSASMNER